MRADLVASIELTGEGRSGVEGGEAPARGPYPQEVPGDPPINPPPPPNLPTSPHILPPLLYLSLKGDCSSNVWRLSSLGEINNGLNSSAGLQTSLTGLSTPPFSTWVW